MNTRSEPAGGPGLDEVMSERRQLMNVGYRLLGSLAEAEDVVQETYARWYAMSPAAAGRHRVAGRLADDGRQPDLPQPARLGAGAAGTLRRRSGSPSRCRAGSPRSPTPLIDPADRVTLDESVNMAFLVVLESMTPAERVAFILHDVFRYSFAEVAEIVGRTPAACRKLASSARRGYERAGTGDARPSSTPRSSGSSSGPGRPRTSTPWSACSTPAPPRPPTAADWP